MFEIRDLADRAEVYLYGRIGADLWGDGNSASGFIDQLNELSPKPIDMHIDSGGGDVFEAYAICAAIQRYDGEVVAYIDGLAASAASYIAVVCDTVKMNEYAWFMIHDASAMTSGNADELEQTAARLREIDKSIATIYERRSLLTLDEIQDAMKAETWYSAAEALEANFCQEVIQTEERMAACVDEITAKEYANKPEAIQISSTSHALPKVEQQASYIAIDGRVFRKESK